MSGTTDAVDPREFPALDVEAVTQTCREARLGWTGGSDDDYDRRIVTAILNHLRPAYNDTGFLDLNQTPIRFGDTVRHATDEPFSDVHGQWVDYTVVHRNGRTVASYLRSEKGAKLPVGFTAGDLDGFIDDEEALDKERYFTHADRYRTVPVTVINTEPTQPTTQDPS
jgi:hypothetical protein